MDVRTCRLAVAPLRASRQRDPRRSFAEALPFSLRALGLGCLFGGILYRVPIVGGDSPALARSSQALVDCMRQAEWVRCPRVERFGLQQHAVGTLFAANGLDEQSIVLALALVNVAVFAVLLFAIWRSLRATPDVRVLVLLVLLTGPLLAYAASSFGEMLSVGLTSLLVLEAARRRRGWCVCVLAAAATTAKETAFVPVLFLGLAALIFSEQQDAAPDTPRRQVGPTIALILGVVVGVLLNSVFNLWRYGAVDNIVYGDRKFRVPGLELKLNALLAQWLSPGGGVAWYWFSSLTILFVPMAVVGARKCDWRRRTAAALLLGAILVSTVGLAAWWSPFGWYAWGPRLLLPAVAPAVLAVGVMFPSEIRVVVRTLRQRSLAAAPLVSASALSAAGNVGYLVNPDRTLAWFFTPRSGDCPYFPDLLSDAHRYYDCVFGPMTWRLDGSLWGFGLRNLSTPIVVVVVLLLGAAILMRRSPGSGVLSATAHCGSGADATTAKRKQVG